MAHEWCGGRQLHPSVPTEPPGLRRSARVRDYAHEGATLAATPVPGTQHPLYVAVRLS